MPLFWLSIAFLGGLLTAAWISTSWWVWAGMALLGIGIGLIERRLFSAHFILGRWRAYTRAPLGIILAALFGGAALFQVNQPHWTAADLAFYNDSNPITLLAQVTAPPEEGSRSTSLRLKAQELTLLNPDGTPSANPIKVSGDLLAKVLPGQNYHYGDILELSGSLVTPASEPEFSYKDYLARQGVYTQMLYPKARRLASGQGNPLMTLIYNLSDYAFQTLNRIFPQPEAALLSGILLGIDRDLPDSLQTAFKLTGTAHIIAISGFNIAIVAGLVSSLFKRLLPRWWALLGAVLGITFYTLMVGATPSVVRAAIMGGLALLGQQIGRRGSGLNTLALTAAVMCIFNPLLPWDTSFQLSFCATLGLVLYADPLQNAFITFAERHIPAEKARRLAEPVGEFFLFTLAAQVTTLPIMAVQFQQISVSALIANPLVLPPQPLVMVLGGIAVVAGMIFLPLGQLLAYVAWPLIAYTNRMVEFLAQLPHGMIKLGETGLIWALLFYAILFSLTFGLPRWPAIRQQLSPTLALVASALLAVFIWRNVLSLPDQRLHVYVFPIADGPAYLIRSPGGNNILINGGSNTSQLQEALARRLPLYTETLDGAILTTTSGPMFEGLANTFTRYPPGLVVWEGPGKNQKAAKQLADQLSQLPNRQVAIPADGLALSVDRDIVMRVVSVTEDYTALQLQWGRFNALIPGGVGEDQIKQALKGNPGKISLVLLTEADLKNSPAADWQSLGASLTVTSGQGKGSIPQEWLNALQHGWVSITSDGQKMWIETER